VSALLLVSVLSLNTYKVEVIILLAQLLMFKALVF
jgi:hypothetical protein